MQSASIPFNENERLQELYNYDILYTQYEEDFDQIVQLASQICGVPISLISLIDKDKQWFKAKTGIDSVETGRDISFCAHAILDEDVFVVEDAWQDERFFDNPLVLNEPSIRFYAGIPLVSKGGYKLGTLCVIDRTPRNLDESQLFALEVLSKQVSKLFELRLKYREIEESASLVNKQKQRLEELNNAQSKIISIISHDIRSPLATLKQIIELNETTVFDESDLKGFMTAVNNQVDGTINLLGNLVDWGNILINNSEIKLQPINLSKLADYSLNGISIAALLKGNNLVNNVVDKTVSVVTDENIIQFIFRNLLSNANKFTSNGTISIGAKVVGKNALINISDTGIGMNSETLNRLFLLGKYASQLGTNNEKGSGLGLLLIKDFIEKIGSQIKIESAIGKGTSVYISLPIA